VKILFFGDGPWGTRSLARLAKDGWQIPGVVLRSKPTDPALATIARDLRVPILQPVDVNGDQFVAEVARLAPDLNVSVSYDQILRGPIRASAPLGFLNFHAGKLPLYRGRNPINWAIINGESEVGITGHFVDEGIDTGDIVLQRTVPVGWTDTYGDVLGRVVEAFPDLVSDTISLVASGDAPRTPQRHLPGTYFAARGEGDEWLDWADTSVRLHNKVRAITRPGPGARTLLGGRRVTVWRAFHDPSVPRYLATPGQVVGRHRGKGVTVKTGDSTILLTEVEVDGTPLGTPDWPIGTRLGVDIHARVLDLETRLAKAYSTAPTSGVRPP
jgi:methionyl-tRNA formyltransferase